MGPLEEIMRPLTDAISILPDIPSFEEEDTMDEQFAEDQYEEDC